MKTFFQSPWVIGILTGLLSGVIIFFLSFWISKAVEKKKHRFQVEMANMEIMRALRPYVAEKGLPTIDITNAIIETTARKYSVKTEELYTIRIVCEELIKEIIENIYVSTEKKSEYSTDLMGYLSTYESNNISEDVGLVTTNRDNKTFMFRETNFMISIVVAVTSAFGVGASLLIPNLFIVPEITTKAIETSSWVMIVALATLLVAILSLFYVFIKKKN